jgi:hypothetical protein
MQDWHTFISLLTLDVIKSVLNEKKYISILRNRESQTKRDLNSEATDCNDNNDDIYRTIRRHLLDVHYGSPAKTEINMETKINLNSLLICD